MKYKYQRKKREEILQMAQDTEEANKQILRDEYVHFIDAIPEIKEFLESLNEKDKESAYASLTRIEAEEDDEELKEEMPVKSKKKEIDIQLEDEDFDPEKFNPFRRDEIKKS